MLWVYWSEFLRCLNIGYILFWSCRNHLFWFRPFKWEQRKSGGRASLVQGMELRKPLCFLAQQQGHSDGIQHLGAQSLCLLRLQRVPISQVPSCFTGQGRGAIKTALLSSIFIEAGSRPSFVDCTISPESPHQSMALSPSSLLNQPSSYPIMRKAGASWSVQPQKWKHLCFLLLW